MYVENSDGKEGSSNSTRKKKKHKKEKERRKNKSDNKVEVPKIDSDNIQDIKAPEKSTNSEYPSISTSVAIVRPKSQGTGSKKCFINRYVLLIQLIPGNNWLMKYNY